MAKFQELVLCTRGAHDKAAPCETEDGEGMVFLHDRLVKAAAEIKATTTLASDAAKWRDLVRRRHLRNIVPKARREIEAGKAVFP